MSWGAIVVGVDASPAGVAAAEAGWEFARTTRSSCVLVHAVRDVTLGGRADTVDLGALLADVERLSRDELARALAGRVPPELIAALEIRVGPTARVLADFARERDAGLVVLGAKRHNLVSRWLGGSTAKNAIRALDVSVLVTTGPGPIGRILAAVDLSDASGPTLAAAEEVARQTGATLRILHVIEPLPYAAEGMTMINAAVLAEEAEAAFERTVGSRVTLPSAERIVRRGPALPVIEEEAVEWRADLIVVGAHGRSRVERIFLGSVSEGIVNALPASILVVRAPPKGTAA
jgi:nucleotide-binding universal stress UspA family protein